LKNDTIDHLVDLFGESFNKIGVTSLDNTYLKYVTDQYRVHLQINTRYECPSMISESEWKNLLEDAKDKTMKKVLGMCYALCTTRSSVCVASSAHGGAIPLHRGLGAVTQTIFFWVFFVSVFGT
jgi:hypothetical protein